MRVLQLEARNFCNLLVVELTRSGQVMVVSGPNENGKTSLINSIFWALKGPKENIPEPIREGQDKAEVKVWLGETEVELIVYRRQTEGSMKLEVTDAQGHVIKQPQAVLDALVNRCSFDPTVFITASKTDRKDMLLDICGVRQEVAELDSQRKTIYDERTLVGRSKDDLEAQMKAVPEEISTLVNPEKAFAELDASLKDSMTENQNRQKVLNDTERVLMQMRADVHAMNNQIGQYEADKERTERRISSVKLELEELEESLKLTNRFINEKQTAIEGTKARIAATEQVISDLPQPDPEALETALALIDNGRRKLEKHREYKKLRQQFQEKDQERTGLSLQIEEIDLKKQALIHTKLGALWKDVILDEEGNLHVAGRMFDSHSTAGQLKISAALAMAANPQLRVMRITHGSELDTNSMNTLAELAEQHDFDIWIEVVSETPGTGIFIEEGRIKGAKE